MLFFTGATPLIEPVMSDVFTAIAPRAPLLISVPHAGREVPDEIRERLNSHALTLPDTDWYVDRLWSWATEVGAGLQIAQYSRYVVDLNRPADDRPLYDTATTGLVPETDFEGRSLYRTGEEPDRAEMADRVQRYWRPYHDALERTLDEMVGRFGHAVLLDAHSIRSRVPRLFDGRLPDLNLGTHDGRSADASLGEDAWQSLDDDELTRVRDGRFKGGHITRHYGRPEHHRHALQLEVAQRAYMDEDRARWDDDRAASFRPVQAAFLGALLEWTPDHG